MWQTILVVIIVAVAVAWFAWRSWRTVSGKDGGCGCSQGGQCNGQSVQDPETIFTISGEGKK